MTHNLSKDELLKLKRQLNLRDTDELELDQDLINAAQQFNLENINKEEGVDIKSNQEVSSEESDQEVFNEESEISKEPAIEYFQKGLTIAENVKHKSVLLAKAFAENTDDFTSITGTLIGLSKTIKDNEEEYIEHAAMQQCRINV